MYVLVPFLEVSVLERVDGLYICTPAYDTTLLRSRGSVPPIMHFDKHVGSNLKKNLFSSVEVLVCTRLGWSIQRHLTIINCIAKCTL